MKYLFDFSNFDRIDESRGSKLAVRTVVRDIVYILKNGFIGKLFLPLSSPSLLKFQVKEPPLGLTEEELEDFYHDLTSDEDAQKTFKYSFTDLPIKFSVELLIKRTNKTKDFIIDGSAGSWIEKEDKQEVKYYDIKVDITYNKKNLEKNLFKIVGELNILISHEIEHLLQSYYEEEFLDSDPYSRGSKYYLQSVELPAQVSGFKRIFDLKKKKSPELKFEDVVKSWFEERRTISEMTEEEEEKVVKNIVGEYYKKYSR